MQFLLGFGPFPSHQVCFSLSLSLSRRMCSSGGRAQPHHMLPEGPARQGDAIGLCFLCIKACTRPFAIAKLQRFCRRGRPAGLHLKMFPVLCVHVSKTLPSGGVIQVNHALAADHKTRNTMTAMIVYKGFG